MTPDPVREAAAETLAAVIAEHDGLRVNAHGWTVCLCGHVASFDDDDGSHALHVADALQAAGYTLAAPGAVVVQVPEVVATEPPQLSPYRTLASCGEAHGRLLPPECADFSDYIHIYAGERGWRSIEHARRSALELLAVAEHLARAATPAPDSDGAR